MNKTRHSVKADAIVFLETAERLGLTHIDLAEKLGYARNSHHGWIASGQIPHVVKVACEGLAKGAPASTDKIWIIRPKDKSSVLAGVLKAMSIPFTELSL